MIEYKYMRQLRNAIENFYPLGNDCWADLESIIDCRMLAKNEHFSREGQFAKEFGFICSGIMRMFYLSEDGVEWNKHFFIENDFVVASIDPKKKSIVNIQALTPVTLICISYSKFMELIHKFPQVNLFLQKMMSAHLERKQEKEIRFLSNEAIDNYKYFNHKYPGLEKIIPLYHIASYLGITPTQLSRIRQQLK
ncbi:MAG: Crp/Fnr family transcriptional regulator [Spirochaetota bacterium]